MTKQARISSEVIKISPSTAEKWLKKNHPSNRRVDWVQVESFAGDMREGRWRLTHQGICFDADGFLTDGQHRLHAIVKAGVDVEILVFTTSEDSFHAPIDRGRPRSIAMISGMTSRKVSALHALRRLESGVLAMKMRDTLGEIEETAATYDVAFRGLERSVGGLYKLQGGVVAALIWSFQIEPEKTIEFARQVITGEMLQRGMPSFAFRSWRDSKERAYPWELSCAAFNCLRHHIHGRNLSCVYTGEAGYRAFCSRRRAQKVKPTPAVDLVPGIGWTPGKKDSGDE